MTTFPFYGRAGWHGCGRRALTLIELICCIAIVALLVILLTPVISVFMLSVNKARDVQNLRSLALAMRSYADANNGRFPLKYDYDITQSSERQWDSVLIAQGYIVPEVLHNPADTTQRSVPGYIRSYKYNGYFGDSAREQANTVEGDLMKVTKPHTDIIILGNGGGDTPVVGSNAGLGAYAHHNCTYTYADGAHFAFADLHVEWMTDSGSYNDSDKRLFLKHWRCDLPQ